MILSLPGTVGSDVEPEAVICDAGSQVGVGRGQVPNVLVRLGGVGDSCTSERAGGLVEPEQGPGVGACVAERSLRAVNRAAAPAGLRF